MLVSCGSFSFLLALYFHILAGGGGVFIDKGVSSMNKKSHKKGCF